MKNISQRSCWNQGDYKMLFSKKKKKCLQQRKKPQSTRLYHKRWQFFWTASTVCSNRYSLTLREYNPYSMTHFEVAAILKQSWFSIKQKHELKGSNFVSRNIRDFSHSERKHESNLFRQNALQNVTITKFCFKAYLFIRQKYLNLPDCYNLYGWKIDRSIQSSRVLCDPWNLIDADQICNLILKTSETCFKYVLNNLCNAVAYDRVLTLTKTFLFPICFVFMPWTGYISLPRSL